jgi:hypothetical protein
MHFTRLATFALSTLSRISAGALMFFTGDVTINTFILVLAPVAFCAFLIALRI